MRPNHSNLRFERITPLSPWCFGVFSACFTGISRVRRVREILDVFEGFPGVFQKDQGKEGQGKNVFEDVMAWSPLQPKPPAPINPAPPHAGKGPPFPSIVNESWTPPPASDARQERYSQEMIFPS